MRIGIGYDVHRLIENRDLIIGGIKIPHEKGLLGHSDADVLVHAIMDSMLGALALGDIGKFFPDNDLKYKNISSLKLLSYVNDLILENGYIIGNIDSIIIAENPKLSPYIKQMRKIISKTLKVNMNLIGIKATTEEGLGFTGKKEGIAAQSICLLNKVSN
ncbi:MAG: 2-C-methyl-D-erythritol 2,4-cyclodiphosphate synthase [Clostridium sp.]|jgi:2-C-methyl-D-erythritol 2,4-cyclodiphosphate synthase|uniref:2-C-methyl-D-erythritol 2,4-cyclodiphosphate synthase n=1 Tax=Clostridium sp. TaxID=1506 RepID=UPI0025BE5C58|nr:2-C-methyl-D-erythritol 2,4-cyclodiphosphate synthase [Clostridium sp.]MCH3965363.1 2-C-methyl-D-erythritol 2,4-cyclodiphosphate synthase [Clostridium sp.]MCI1714584.1 2-C-methyl-D-erythritol 2,4-cyclodiphosphate synthase [Clostridium sp.]MCI1798846.1 2-C-methyl-D-erythritol 2,4-cyclodiphosphate synthase [Clostridium sp.]MCI1812423.1 2-C-methyl-D-erythritol 2,4-cyclodiphosphate synthase [Clostridium sp.]MCI1869656.1 2-C-methyl-D-erythritol 2,4-cyclodiphosphate synthase [Clostridium sp.]